MNNKEDASAQSDDAKYAQVPAGFPRAARLQNCTRWDIRENSNPCIN